MNNDIVRNARIDASSTRRTFQGAAWLAVAAVGLVLVACSPTNDVPDAPPTSPLADEPTGPPEICPERAESAALLPRVTAEHESLDYWLTQLEERYDLDEELMTQRDIAANNESMLNGPGGAFGGMANLTATVDDAAIQQQVDERIAWMAGRIDDGAYVAASGSALAPDIRTALAPRSSRSYNSSVVIAAENIPVRCAPHAAPMYTESLDLRFDRNNCSTIHAQEPLQILADEGDLLLVRNRYTLGWIDADAAVSQQIPVDEVDMWVTGTRASVLNDHSVTADDGTSVALQSDTMVLSPEGDTGPIYLADAAEIRRVATPNRGQLQLDARPLTRRTLLQEAFSYLNSPYGWGGQDGGRDCSRFLQDTFEQFGLDLPRHSANQALAGTFSFDVSEVENENERMLLIDAAADKGIVLLSFPGHIMLYLGRNAEGTPMAIHSFAEYVQPCDERDPGDPEDAETLYEVDRISVSDLELGRGSSRTAFIERLTRITVIGDAPGYELQGVAELRAPAPVEIPEAAACDDREGMRIFFSPRTPNAEQPLRIIVTSSEDPGPVELALITPDGSRITPEFARYGAPPWSYVSTIQNPSAGDWTVSFGDGSRVEACANVTVRDRAPTRYGADTGGIWDPRNEWNEDFENLYSVWVESLFNYDIHEEQTWTNLHDILQDPDRNILYDHLSQNDESRLDLEPDCADLPYLVRAYFSWKAGLPFGYRRCSRGRAGSPPTCHTLQTNLMSRPTNDDIDAFQYFADAVRNGVHSGAGRPAPDDSETDWYPVEMTREAIRPGTMFADPYGHLLVVTRWAPQSLDDYGILVAAEAQPDATVGQRRFWRGSFLFTPDTHDVGSGFKAFRPIVYDRRTRTMTSVPNSELDGDPYIRWSDGQYAGTSDDFYESIESLVNPRPLDPIDMQTSLVDALEESVSLRLNSVNNGEDYMLRNGYREVVMPEGYDIFETSGAWEDFSTPSRDMRLLISIDTVINFTDAVRRNPDRFGLRPDELDQAAIDLAAALDATLRERSLTYTRSDGTTWDLTMRDVIDRTPSFEVSYNPNDCPEIRWAAPEDSEEYSTCDRHAPRWQLERMADYRSWFIDRARPPR